MFIEPMSGLGKLSGLEGLSRGQNDFFSPQKVQNKGVFKDIFLNAVQDVKIAEDELAKAEYMLATGQISDPHTVPIASAKAQASVDLLVNLRNKALDVYNELMRMNI